MNNHKVDAIIFSRCRPWQMQQLIKSMLALCDFDHIYVILKIDKEYQENYAKVESQFNNHVTFIREDKSFFKQLKRILSTIDGYISFMVDDLVFFDIFSSKDAISLMREKPVFSYQFKLNPSYDFYYIGSRQQKIPENFIKSGQHWMWKEDDGTWDWYYPFDMTGSIYHSNDIKYIMTELSNRRILNPNLLEMYGTSFVFKHGIEILNKEFMACQSNRVCACLSLNHSHEKVFTPHNDSEECGIQYLNNYVFGKYDYDLDFFRNYNQRSVHITDYRLKEVL